MLCYTTFCSLEVLVRKQRRISLDLAHSLILGIPIGETTPRQLRGLVTWLGGIKRRMLRDIDVTMVIARISLLRQYPELLEGLGLLTVGIRDPDSPLDASSHIIWTWRRTQLFALGEEERIQQGRMPGEYHLDTASLLITIEQPSSEPRSVPTLGDAFALYGVTQLRHILTYDPYADESVGMISRLLIAQEADMTSDGVDALSLPRTTPLTERAHLMYLGLADIAREYDVEASFTRVS